jgi:NDP-sugar pyrophosphorylase family protein
VKIHPSAYVHNSVLEDGVTLEANASVVDSHVGAGVHIADHAVIAQCVLGAGCRTLVDTHLRRVIALPDSTLSNLDLQDVVIGTGVFVTTAVAYFQGQKGMPLVVDGVAVTRPVVGGAIGARCRLGSRALLAAGVSLPPGAVVVARPEEALAKIDAQGLGRAAMMLGDRTRDA